MVAIKKTNTLINNSNKTFNDAKLYIQRKFNASSNVINWDLKSDVHWEKYQIKETDMRVKTATFTSTDYIDLTTGTFAVLITSPFHEDFSGIILDVDFDKDTGLYSYQCQDHSRAYQSKVDVILPAGRVTTHRLLQYLISRETIPIVGKISAATLENNKKRLSGLRPAYQYSQKLWGSVIDFNPMTQKNQMIIRDKSFIEAIRSIVYGSGAYIDVYFNKYGILQIEPYHKDDLFNTGLYLTLPEIASAKYNYDTTNIITNVLINNSDKTRLGRRYLSEQLIKLDLSAIFGSMGTSINAESTTSNSSNNINKKSTTATKTSNPYKTKKKVVWLNSDNIKGKSADRKFLNDCAKLLQKNGWKTKVVGVGPNTHTEKYMGPKNGVWFCVYGGADGAVFKEAAGKNTYSNKLKKLGSRTVIGMRGGGDIRKGGKYYKWLPRAHDDNYSPSSYKGISYPLNVLTKAKVPIMYADTAQQMVSKFLSGGDNKGAC